MNLVVVVVFVVARWSGPISVGKGVVVGLFALLALVVLDVGVWALRRNSVCTPDPFRVPRWGMVPLE